MSKALWACSICGEDFTRRSSAERHSNNLHQGRKILTLTSRRSRHDGLIH
jgi:hypothetical protein